MADTPPPHPERHLTHRATWLRAGVLGANDGIVSTASLVLGVAAATPERSAILTAGVAALAAGALSMAVGEYVSVSSQRDTERADIARERWELTHEPERELDELTGMYRARGVPEDLARQVAEALTANDALGTHLTEELGITEALRARPLQAAWTSALSFALGAVLPLVAMAAAGPDTRVAVTVVVALVALALMGSLAARLGGAPPARAAARVVVGGAAAMGVTAAIGALIGTAIA